MQPEGSMKLPLRTPYEHLRLAIIAYGNACAEEALRRRGRSPAEMEYKDSVYREGLALTAVEEAIKLYSAQQSEDAPSAEPAASWAFASSLTAASEMYHDEKHGPMCTCELSKLLREFAGGMMTERCKDADERRAEQAESESNDA